MINIAYFEPHTFDSNLCKSNVENEDLQIKTFDKIMMSNSYNKIVVPGNTCKRTYSKHSFEQGLVIDNFFLCNG